MAQYIEVSCNQCNKNFEIYQKKSTKMDKNFYCCRECYELSKRKYILVTCKSCQSEFEIRAREKPFRYFCCEFCENNFKTNNKYDIKYCKQCNKEIMILKAGTKNKEYCSLECKTAYVQNMRMITKICKWCNNEFKTHNDSTFCSISCSSKFGAKKNEFGSKIRPKEIWNKGLNIDDPRVKKGVKKQKATFAKNLAEGKIIMYYTGKTLTSEHRKNIAIANAIAVVEGRRPHLPRFKGGIREDLGHYCRSSWEANFARILKYLNRNYEHESQYFELSNGKTYTPDFYDYKKDCFYEIKGFWIRDAKEKFEQFKLDYPHIKIRLIEHKKYKRIINIFKNKIKFE